MEIFDPLAVAENLRDAGCGEAAIAAFLDALKQDRVADGLQLLTIHRRDLLDALHKDQQQIDRLDYLIYQMTKTATTTREETIR